MVGTRRRLLTYMKRSDLITYRALIDELKATVPIWKNQVCADGSQEWVGL